MLATPEKRTGPLDTALGVWLAASLGVLWVGVIAIGGAVLAQRGGWAKVGIEVELVGILSLSVCALAMYVRSRADV